MGGKKKPGKFARVRLGAREDNGGVLGGDIESSWEPNVTKKKGWVGGKTTKSDLGQ